MATTDIRTWDGQNWVSLQGPSGSNGTDGTDGKGLNGNITGEVTTVPPETDDGNCSTLSNATLNATLVPDADGNFTLNMDLGVPGGICGDAGSNGTSATVSLAGNTTETLPYTDGVQAEVDVSDLASGDPNDLQLSLAFKIPEGKPGTGITIKGSVATEAELPDCATYAGDEGDMYIVVTNQAGDKGHGFVYNGKSSDCWDDVGQIKGQDGTDGCNPNLQPSVSSTLTLAAGDEATASVVRAGTNCDPTFAFTFGIPKGADGGNGTNGTNATISLDPVINLGDRCATAGSGNFTIQSGGTNNPVYKANMEIPYVKVHKGSGTPTAGDTCTGDFWIVTD